MVLRNLILLLGLLCLATVVRAETFSCTDANGKRHIADTLMRLPAECRNQAETLEPQDSGKVNYVPPPPASTKSSQQFKDLIRSEDEARQRKEQYKESLLRRATAIADSFENARQQRKEALRSKKYGNREQIQSADRLIQRSRADKQALLEEISSENLSSAERSQIEAELDRVE